jgi:hypothetical protein
MAASTFGQFADRSIKPALGKLAERTRPTFAQLAERTMPKVDAARNELRRMFTRSRLEGAGACAAFALILGLSAPAAGFAETTGPQAASPATDVPSAAAPALVPEQATGPQPATPGAVDAAAAAPVAPSSQELHPVAVTAAQTTFTPTHEQLANAKAIIDAGKALNLSPRAWTIAVATSLQESNLRNLGHLGANNDHDSLGLFQQRPSSGWGTPSQVQDPNYAATAFYHRLVNVPGWNSMALTRAAQTVQVSAFPQAYAKHEVQAGDIIEALYGAGPYAGLATDLR